MKKNNHIFSDMRSLSIIGTFFFLWLAIFFEDAIENIFAYTLILSFGIIHGANDIKLLEKVGVSKKMNLLRLTLYYTLFVLLNFIFFYFIPSLALLLFIVFSGYHFGEQHWVSRTKGAQVWKVGFFMTYGLLILFLLFQAHQASVNAVIETITGLKMPVYVYLGGIWTTGVLLVLVYTILNYKRIDFNEVVLELFFLAVFFIVFNTASLLWSFAIYFVLWHSIPSLLDQIIFLYGSCTRETALKYFKSSFFYWLFAILGLVIALFFLKDTIESSLALFFSFLAAITFPHVLVIKKLNTP